MNVKTLAAAAVLTVVAGAANAQLAPTVDGLCAAIDSRPGTPMQKGAARIVCASPRLRANAQRFINQVAQLDPLINRDEGAEVIARLKARNEEHEAYCHVTPNPQLPPSDAMVTCLAYWQEHTMADMDTLIARAQGRQSQAAVQDFLGRLGTGLQQWQDNISRNQPTYAPAPTFIPPQSCQSQPNGGGWMTTCQ